MKFIRYLSLASLLISGFATAMQVIPNEIEVSNQAEELVNVWHTRPTGIGDIYGKTEIYPYDDQKFDNYSLALYTSKGEYVIEKDYNGPIARLFHQILTHENNKWSGRRESLQEELIKSGKKLVAIVNPDGTVFLTTR